MKDLRQIVKEAQRRDLHDEEPDHPIEMIAASCNVNRSHLFELMSGKPDPSLVKEWTLHRLSKGLDVETEVLRAAIALSHKRANPKRKKSSLID
jgi:hypothetical protein